MPGEQSDEENAAPREASWKLTNALRKQDKMSKELKHPFKLDVDELRKDARTKGFITQLEANNKLERLNKFDQLFEKHSRDLKLVRNPELIKEAFIDGVNFLKTISTANSMAVAPEVIKRLNSENTKNASDFDKGYAYLTYRNEDGRSPFSKKESGEEFITRLLITTLAGEMRGLNLTQAGIERIAITLNKSPKDVAKQYESLFKDFVTMGISDQEAGGRYRMSIKKTFKDRYDLNL